MDIEGNETVRPKKIQDSVADFENKWISFNSDMMEQRLSLDRGWH